MRKVENIRILVNQPGIHSKYFFEVVFSDNKAMSCVANNINEGSLLIGNMITLALCADNDDISISMLG